MCIFVNLQELVYMSECLRTFSVYNKVLFHLTSTNLNTGGINIHHLDVTTRGCDMVW